MGKGINIARTKAKKTTAGDGTEFPSKAEAARWDYLRMLERGGAIRGLMRQPSYRIFAAGPVAIYYTSDFQYHDGKRTVVEEVKGMAKDSYLMRRRMFVAMHPDLPLYEIRGKKRLRVYLTGKGICRTKVEPLSEQGGR